VEQNSELWKQFRDSQYGCSGLSTLTGWSHYCTNVLQWQMDTGRIPYEKWQTEDDIKFANHGHWYEDETADIVSILMGVETSVHGIHINPKYMYLHASVDRIIKYKDGVYHNKHTLFDARRCVLEIKNPYYAVLQIKHVKELNQPIHNIAVDYVFQVIGQCYVMNDIIPSGHIDFAAEWRFNDDNPPKYISSGKFLIAHVLVSRIYKNDLFMKKMYDLILKHVDAVRNDQEPKLIQHVEFPAIRFLPLKAAKFYLHVPMDEQNNPIYSTEVDKNGLP
jgi:hypothetical protein